MVMVFFARYKRTILILCLIGLLYFLLRLPNLTLQPIFADEAIYIRWAQVMRAEPTLRFLPLSDGKTPLFMWVMIPLFKFFDDPLYTGRFLSVLSGFVTLGGVFFLGWRFFNLSTGLWSAFLISTTPFLIFFDRMALVDSMLAAFSVWSLNLALSLIKYNRLDLAMFLGYFLGGGMLTKTSGVFNALMLPVSIIAFKWSKTDRQKRLLKIFGLWMIAVIIAMIIYNILRLGPGFDNLSSRNQDYIFSPVDLLGRPLDPFLPHFNDLKDWLPKLLGWPVLFLTIGGISLAIIRRRRWALVILLWGLLPLLVQMALLKTFTARYILFSIPPLLVLAAWVIDWLTDKIKGQKIFWQGLILVILTGAVLPFNFLLLTNPSLAPLPREERRGYFEDWTAGYGLKEIADFLIEKSQLESIVVSTEGGFGTLPDGLLIYLDRYFHSRGAGRISIVAGKTVVSPEVLSAAFMHPTFAITNGSRLSSRPAQLQLLKEYPKVEGPNFPQNAIILFQVVPQK